MFKYLAFVGFANSRASEDTKQVLSGFMYVSSISNELF